MPRERKRIKEDEAENGEERTEDQKFARNEERNGCGSSCRFPVSNENAEKPLS